MRLLFIAFILSKLAIGQNNDPLINSLNKQLDSLKVAENSIIQQLEEAKLSWIRKEIKRIGVPKSDKSEIIISHSALSLSYNEEHEQANWVMHIIMPDIIEGNVSRSNDFRIDTLISTGSAEEKDYFTKTKQENGKYKYDGFGFDRGHLAPSADFRWSAKALSESYFYSNMSPQIGDFNRRKWAELENWLRDYVSNSKEPLYVITAPVLNDDLKKSPRSKNGLSVPEYFVKSAIDVKAKKGIAFIMPHQAIRVPIESFAVTIDSAESILGYDLFPNIDDELENEIESEFDYHHWMPIGEKGDVRAIANSRLPKNAVNSYDGAFLKDDGKKHTVCGKVVSTKKHNKGHVFMNLDKQFPNQIFSVTIFDSNIKNFTYEPEIYLKNQEVCFTGKITDYKGTASMTIENGKDVKLLSDF